MKKTILAISAGLLFLMLTAGDCKKNNSEASGNAPTPPSVSFNLPGTSDACSQQVYSIVSFINANTTVLAAFAALPHTQNGNDYTWTVPQDSLTVTVKGTRQSDGTFTWEVRFNGVEDGVSYSNKLMLSGSTSADGKSGSFTAYDDTSSTVVGSFSYATAANGDVTGTFTEYSSGNPVYKYDVLSKAAGGGSLTESMWNGSAWVASYTATWATTGGAATGCP